MEPIRLILIAAVAENRVIGMNNHIPWPKIQEDIDRFVRLTTHHPVIMGRVTFESILRNLGHPLLNRDNYVVSRNANFGTERTIVYSSVDAAIRSAVARAPDDGKIYVIGGQKIYEQTIGNADILELTKIHKVYEGNKFFPSFDQREWGLVDKSERHEGNPPFTFETYERR